MSNYLHKVVFVSFLVALWPVLAVGCSTATAEQAPPSLYHVAMHQGNQWYEWDTDNYSIGESGNLYFTSTKGEYVFLHDHYYVTRKP